MDQPTESGTELLKLADATFGPLSDSEKMLLLAAPRGEWAACGPVYDIQNVESDPAYAEDWAASRKIRADLIRWLCVDPVATAKVDPRGIQVQGATIVEPLDLSFISLPFPLGLWGCWLTHNVNLTSAEIPVLGLPGTRTGLLLADRLVTKGDVLLRHGFSAQGWVRLIGARIGGKLDCVDAVFYNPADGGTEGAGTALSADGIQVEGDVFLSGRFLAAGGIRLTGARIGGTLDCGGGVFYNPKQKGLNRTGIALNAVGASIGGSLNLGDGFISDGQVCVQGAQIGQDLICAGAALRNVGRDVSRSDGFALNANGVAVKGSVVFSGGFRAEGEVSLIGGAQIRGQLVASGGTFLNPVNGLDASGVALGADGLVVDGGIFLSKGFRALGQVRLRGARVGAILDCGGGMFQNPPQPDLESSGVAINAIGIEIKGDAFLNEGFRSEGAVVLSRSRIGGDFQCAAGTFNNPGVKGVEKSGKALAADGIRVNGRVLLSDGFRAHGEVRMIGGNIGGQLSCRGGMFENPALKDVPSSGRAFSGDGLHCDNDLFLDRSFSAEGEVRLAGAQVGGDLSCKDGRLRNPIHQGVPEATGIALAADGLQVAGNVSLSDGFRAEGALQLRGAQIDGSLDCTGAIIELGSTTSQPECGPALAADGINVKGRVLLCDGFKTGGKVCMSQAKIGMDLECVDVDFGGLIAEGMSVGKILWWKKVRRPTATVLNLTNAVTDALLDDSESWPVKGKLAIDGFVYDRFPDGPRTSKDRLEWLGRSDRFTPQPYRQLARVFRDTGLDEDAVAVLIEMEDRRRRADRRRLSPLWRLVLSGTIAYGYRPLRAFWWLLLITTLGWGFYTIGENSGQMVPTEKEAFQTFKTTKGAPEDYPRFSPLVYSLETCIPLIKLGQTERWQPNPSANTPSTSGQPWYLRIQQAVTRPRFLVVFRWAQIMCGWLLATLFVAGLTGVVRRL